MILSSSESENDEDENVSEVLRLKKKHDKELNKTRDQRDINAGLMKKYKTEVCYEQVIHV